MQREPKKILIIQLKRAGDILLTTPIPALLKRRWPQARVDFLADQAFVSLLDNNPAIDRVQKYDRKRVWHVWRKLRAEGYSHVFDFQSSPRSAMAVLATGAPYTAGYRVPFWGRVYHTTVRRPGNSQTVIEGKVSLIEPLTGPLTEVPPTQVVLTAAERAWAQTARNDAKGRRLIGMIPTHRRASRRWHPEAFADLARQLDQAGYAIWLFWGPGERDYVEQLLRQIPFAQMIPPTTWRQMAALLQCCELVVTSDNGPMHLAVASGAPTVTLYGPTDPRAWNPGGPRHRSLQAEGLTCLGCNLNTCPFGHECMTQLSAATVFSACQELLARTSRAVPV